MPSNCCHCLVAPSALPSNLPSGKKWLHTGVVALPFVPADLLTKTLQEALQCGAQLTPTEMVGLLGGGGTWSAGGGGQATLQEGGQDEGWTSQSYLL